MKLCRALALSLQVRDYAALPHLEKTMASHKSNRLLTALLALFLLSSCDFLRQLQKNAAPIAQGVKPLLPKVTYQDATLVQAPSRQMMAAYFCPQVVPDPFGVPGVAALACRQAFGPQPTAQQMIVAFDLRFMVDNPNHFPIPVAEMLTAATVFPANTNTALGAACVVFCGANQPGCTGHPGPNSCRASSRDIRSVQDFQNAAVNFLIASGIHALAGQKPSFLMPQVVSDGHIQFTARFSFGPDALLTTLREVAKQAIGQLKSGQQVQFEIPYRLQGTVWFDVGSLGRVSVGFGPADGKWIIPTSSLIAQ